MTKVIAFFFAANDSSIFSLCLCFVVPLSLCVFVAMRLYLVYLKI